jgi:hypothetical protein
MLKHDLPSIICKNASSVLQNGEILTDSIAFWLQKGFLAGPFHSSPLQNFRTNQLMAKEEKLKIRPILNLSAPKNISFNDAIDTDTLQKLTMSSPAIFSQKLLAAGKHARFTKEDLESAYKLIPVSPEDWHIYGFEWLGKFFVRERYCFWKFSSTCPF